MVLLEGFQERTLWGKRLARRVRAPRATVVARAEYEQAGYSVLTPRLLRLSTFLAGMVVV